MMKTTLASLAAAGLLVGGTAAFAVEAPYSAPQPDRIDAQAQSQESVPAVPSAAESYSSGQLAAPGEAESSPDLDQSGSATTPQGERGASSGAGGSSDASGGG